MTTYAGERLIHDTDSHLMEPVDWLVSYADSSVASKLRDLSLLGGGDAATHELVEQCWARRDDPEETAKLAADVVGGPKGYFAYGSMDAGERVGALDQLGFASQLVFTTFAHTQFHARGDVDLAYGGLRPTTAASPTSARLTRGCSAWRSCRWKTRSAPSSAREKPSKWDARPHGSPTACPPR